MNQRDVSEPRTPHTTQTSYQSGERRSPVRPRPLPSIPPPPQPSFVERRTKSIVRKPSLEPVIEGEVGYHHGQHLRTFNENFTKHQRFRSVTDPVKERLSYNEVTIPPRQFSSERDRLWEESMIVTEIKTNVLVPHTFFLMLVLEPPTLEERKTQVAWLRLQLTRGNAGP